MLKKILLIAILVAIFSGCSNKQKLNNNNIKNAINQYYNDNLFCIKLPVSLDYKLINEKIYFGDKVIKIVRINENGKKINKKAIAQMKVLKNNKFYMQHSDENISSRNKGVIYLAKYTLTPKGEKFMSTNKGICIGNAKVKQVNWYTPEINSGVLTLTRVSYLESIDLFNWSKDLFKNFDTDIMYDIFSNKDKEAILFKTNKGWRDLRYLKRYKNIVFKK